MDCSPPGSSVHKISQARILERVAISFFRGSSWPSDWIRVSYASCTGRRILYQWDTWDKPWEFLYECQKYLAVVGLEIPKCLPQTPQTIQIKNYFESSGLQPPKKSREPSVLIASMSGIGSHVTALNQNQHSIPHHMYFNPSVETQFS